MENDGDPEAFVYGSGLPIFMCERCQAHLASSPEACTTILVDQTILFPEIQCRNLVIQPPEHQLLHWNGSTWHARVYCRLCYSEMGFKIIREENPNNIYQERMICLYMPMLLLWNGHDLFSLMNFLPKQPPPPPLQDEPPFFLCRVCNTHFASKNQLLKIDFKGPRIFFSDSMNLVVDSPERLILHANGTTWLGFVRCSGCKGTRGMKIVREENPDEVDREGSVGLDMAGLNIWNGSGHEVLTLMGRLPLLMDLPPSQHDHQLPPPPPPPLPSPPPSPYPPVSTTRSTPIATVWQRIF